MFLEPDGTQLPQSVNWTQWPASAGGNDHWYALTSRPQSWTAAEGEAASHIGHLVSVNTASGQTFLEVTFLTGPNRIRPIWIGLTDAAREGDFVWSSGEPFSYSNWNAGEPNSSLEDWVAFNWHDSWALSEQPPQPLGSWNDTPLNGTLVYTQSDGPCFGIMETAGNPFAPVITSQPLGQTVMAGTPVTFTVLADGESIAYQWFYQGTALSGQIGPSLPMTNVTANQSGNYFAVVTKPLVPSRAPLR